MNRTIRSIAQSSRLTMSERISGSCYICELKKYILPTHEKLNYRCWSCLAPFRMNHLSRCEMHGKLCSVGYLHIPVMMTNYRSITHNRSAELIITMMNNICSTAVITRVTLLSVGSCSEPKEMRGTSNSKWPYPERKRARIGGISRRKKTVMTGRSSLLNQRLCTRKWRRKGMKSRMILPIPNELNHFCYCAFDFFVSSSTFYQTLIDHCELSGFINLPPFSISILFLLFTVYQRHFSHDTKSFNWC